MTVAELRLKKQEERRLLAGNLWIFSNEVDTKATPLKQFTPGQLIQIKSYNGQLLGIGYINPHTVLCARLLTRNNKEIDLNFFVGRIKKALTLRESLFHKPFYRLVFGESDQLPGLIVDRYDTDLVVQITTAGMEQFKEVITDALQQVIQPNNIILRNDSSMRELENLPNYIKAAIGNIPDILMVEENGVRFQIPFANSQKTGWFYDQRYNRQRLQNYVRDKRVLDMFSYMGGWGIAAAVFGAQEVLCVDSSAVAIQQLQENAKLNQVQNKVHTQTGDAFEVLKTLKETQQKFDVIIVDPPAFIKKRKDSKEGELAYLRINELAMQLLVPGGILISCSCSMHLSQSELANVIRKASVKLKRFTQILEYGYQAPDHPIHPAIEETLYLKAVFCRVN